MQLELDFATAEKLEAMQQAAASRAAAGQFSGKAYMTTAESCSCPHWQNRLKGTGVQCKHQIARAAQEAERAARVERTHVGTVIRPKGDMFARIFG